MRLWHTLRRLHRHLKQSRRVSAPRLPAFRPQLEALEERQLLSTMSAINCNSGGVEHQVVYTIGKNNDVLLSVDGRSPVSLGGYAKQISAGLDATGHPEVFAIGSDNAVYENRGHGWVDLGGNVKQISAGLGNTVYAIGSGNAVYEKPG